MEFNLIEDVNEAKSEAIIIKSDAGEAIISNLTSKKLSFSSIDLSDANSKKIAYKAAMKPDKDVIDCINMDITLKDIYCEAITITDENTGELITLPHIVLIDIDGVTYQCVSKGIYNSVKSLINFFGTPTWVEGINVTIKQVKLKKDNKQMLVLELKD